MVLGNPVWGKDFFDRLKEREKLHYCFNEFKEGRRNNLAIIGLRKIGKTSLIKQFIFELEQKKEKCFIIDVYLPEKDTESFISRVLMEIIKGSLKKMKIKEVSLNIDSALDIIQTKYPRSTLLIMKIFKELNNKKYDLAFTLLFDLLDIFSKEFKNKIVIFLDEFQRLVEYEKDIESPIDKFRERLMLLDNCLFIVSGSSVGMLNRLIASSKSPLYGHLDKISLRVFNFEDSIEFINKKKRKNIEIGKNKILFLYEITNGNPFYLDIIINEFNLHKFNLHNNGGVKKINNTLFQEILMKQIFKVDGRIYSYFDSLMEQSLTQRGAKNYSKILFSLSDNNRRPSKISKDTKIPFTTLPAYLKKLQELELIEKIKRKKGSKISEYDFIDSMFKLWIKYVYSMKEDVLFLNIKDEIKIKQDNLNQMMETFHTQIGQSYEVRIRELFRKFNNEIIDDVLLPKFSEVENLNSEIEIDVVAKNKEHTWVVEITKEHMNYPKFNKFKKKLELFKEKVTKKIIILTCGIDKKVEETAKKEGYEIWHLDFINKLMKEYSLYRILPL